MHFLEFKHAFTKSECSFPLKFLDAVIEFALHFVEFTHAEPKYTYVFPSRSQWAVVALNNSCSNDPYIRMTSNHMSTMDVMVTVISTRFCFVCTVEQSFIKRGADVFKTYSSSLADPYHFPCTSDPLFSASINGGAGAVGVPDLFTAIIHFFKGAFAVIKHANFNPVQFS
jgi:hypothetical protein